MNRESITMVTSEQLENVRHKLLVDIRKEVTEMARKKKKVNDPIEDVLKDNKKEGEESSKKKEDSIDDIIKDTNEDIAEIKEETVDKILDQEDKKVKDKKKTVKKKSTPVTAMTDNFVDIDENIVEKAINTATKKELIASEQITKNEVEGNPQSDSDSQTNKFSGVDEYVQEVTKDVVTSDNAEQVNTVDVDSESLIGDDSESVKEESISNAESELEAEESIDIVEFFDTVPTLEQVCMGAGLLAKYDTYLSVTENNGAAVFGHIIMAVIRTSKYDLLPYAQQRYDLFSKSLIEMNEWLISNCTDSTVVDALKRIGICLR